MFNMHFYWGIYGVWKYCIAWIIATMSYCNLVPRMQVNLEKNSLRPLYTKLQKFCWDLCRYDTLPQGLSNWQPAVASRRSVSRSYIVKIFPNFRDSRSSPGSSDLIIGLALILLFESKLSSRPHCFYLCLKWFRAEQLQEQSHSKGCDLISELSREHWLTSIIRMKVIKL